MHADGCKTPVVVRARRAVKRPRSHPLHCSSGAPGPSTASTLAALSSSPSGGSLGDPSSSDLRCIGLEERLFGSRSQSTPRHPFEVLQWRRNPEPDCAEIKHLKRRAWRRASCPKKTC